MAQASGDALAVREANARIKRYKDKYAEISDITGIAQDRKRMTLTKGADSGKIREKSENKITPITENAIKSVKRVEISGFSDEQNAYIQEQHKELLKYARYNNNSNEVAFVFRKGLTDKMVFKGSDDVIDFGNGLNGKGDNLFIMHNHPRNSSFSNIDILFFKDCDTVKTMTVIKNNGNIEYLVKSSEYDAVRFRLEYDRLKSKIIKNGTNAEYEKFIETLLRKSKSGIEWSENNE